MMALRLTALASVFVTAVSCDTQPQVMEPASRLTVRVVADAACSEAYRLEPVSAAAGSTKAVIYIHGWDPQLDTCEKWGAFAADKQGLEVFSALKSVAGLSAVASFWRYTYPTFNSIELAAADLKLKVEDLAPNTQVVLIGHSMGGLVARRAAQMLAGSHVSILRIITLGTPHRGAKAATVGFYTAAAISESIIPNLSTQGALDLQPKSEFMRVVNLITGERDRVYSIVGMMGDGAGPCGHKWAVCRLYDAVNAAHMHLNSMPSDGIVEMSSAALTNNTKRNFHVANYDHTELARGDFNGTGFSKPDRVLALIGLWVAEVLPTPDPLIQHVGPPGRYNSIATGVNNGMEVVGFSSGDEAGSQRFFFWSRATAHIEFGVPSNTSLPSINNFGVVVGTLGNPDRAFRWQQTSGIVELTTPSGCTSQASGINDAGVIAGSINCGRPSPAIWNSANVRTDLPLPESELGANAVDINSRGDVLVECSYPCGGSANYIWLGSTAKYRRLAGITWGAEQVRKINYKRRSAGSVNTGWGPSPVVWSPTGYPEDVYCTAGDSGMGHDIDEADLLVASLIYHSPAYKERGALCGPASTIILKPLWGLAHSKAYGTNSKATGVKYVVGTSHGGGASVATIWTTVRPN